MQNIKNGEMESEEILNKAEAFSSWKKRDLLLIVYAHHELSDPKNRIVVIKEFGKGIIKGENFTLYLMRNKPKLCY